jgi:hypothetical protein
MIQRYAMWIDEDGALSLHPHDAGKCVLYADHLREVERLRALLKEWNNLPVTLACEDFHHAKPDRHELEPCPPLMRFRELVRRTDAELGEK